MSKTKKIFKADEKEMIAFMSGSNQTVQRDAVEENLPVEEESIPAEEEPVKVKEGKKNIPQSDKHKTRQMICDYDEKYLRNYLTGQRRQRSMFFNEELLLKMERLLFLNKDISLTALVNNIIHVHFEENKDVIAKKNELLIDELKP